MFRKQNKRQSIKKDLVFIRMNVLSYRDSKDEKSYRSIHDKPVLIMFYKRHNINGEERFWQ